MKIGYVYEHDAADVTVQSGYPNAILRELLSHDCTVVRAFALDPKINRRLSWKKLYYRAGGRIYRPDREPAALTRVAARARRALEGERVDCVFAPGSHAVARLNIRAPKVFCADATFRNVLDFYEDFTGCADEYIRQGDEQDRLALETSAAAIYTSHWAADSAMAHYGADPGKVHVVPFGATVDALPYGEIKAQVARRSLRTINVLFIGREWKRKGLPKVIDACHWLVEQRVSVSLDVVGAEGYRGTRPGFARFHGFLNKTNEAARTRLERLLVEAHFLCVPSLAENYGIVFCEAAAYGVPAVTTNVGGIPTIVQHDLTGLTFSVDASPKEFGAGMLQVFSDRKRYEAMALRSYEEYNTRLNWRAFGDRLMQIMVQVRDGA